MPKSTWVGLFVFGQVAALLALGLATIGWSQSLMVGLIHQVGEGWALGPTSVIHRADGLTLLSNPGAMFRWMLPI